MCLKSLLCLSVRLCSTLLGAQGADVEVSMCITGNPMLLITARLFTMF